MQNEKVICNKFSFAYDSNTFGIHDIDLTIQEGEFIVLTGKSGCGKTTLTRCINGLIPDFFEGTITGSCRVCGMDISEHETGDYSSYVGSVFQDPRSQFFTLHVKTEIPFPSENLGTPSSVIQDRFRNTVKQLNISNLLKAKKNMLRLRPFIQIMFRYMSLTSHPLIWIGRELSSSKSCWGN